MPPLKLFAENLFDMALFPDDNRSTGLSGALDYFLCCLSESRIGFR